MKRRYLRHIWSHESLVHRKLVRLAYKALRYVPFTLKYGLGQNLRKAKIPYSLVAQGATVIQIGAPRDTLLSGRSRAIFFARSCGARGKVVIIEPDEMNIAAFRDVAQRKGLEWLNFCPVGAWGEKKVLKLYIDDAHPASNFTEGTKEYDERRLKDYRVVEIPVDTVDNIVRDLELNSVDLVSITTNGAEREILKGMQSVISTHRPHIALACTGSQYEIMMKQLGYELLGHDDRGYTFAPCAANKF